MAEKWGLRPDGSNPCRHVEKFKEAKRERYLSADELARLGDVLAERERMATEAPSVVAAVRLLILTGCRLSEILTLQWPHVDFADACLRLPDSKTGAKMVHLNAPALALLAAMERERLALGYRRQQAQHAPGQSAEAVGTHSGGGGDPRPAAARLEAQPSQASRSGSARGCR